MEQMAVLGIEYEGERAVDRAHMADVLRARHLLKGVDAHTACAIKRLWSDAGVRRCFAERSKFQLADSAM